MATEFVIYTDESVKDGAYFSNFYGGVLVRSRDLTSVAERLARIKAEQNLHGELKWVKVTWPIAGDTRIDTGNWFHETTNET